MSTLGGKNIVRNPNILWLGSYATSGMQLFEIDSSRADVKVKQEMSCENVL